MNVPSNFINDETAPSTSISMDANKSVVRMRKIRRVGTACSDYQAKEKDELSLRHGSVVEILTDDSGEDGWVVARIDKKKGIVPEKFVVLIGSTPDLINAEEVKREQLLDSGAMANVFRGYYKNQEVALKVPKKSTEQNIEDLQREALILSRINHENIVGFYGLELETPLIALEFCPGGNLLNLYRKMTSSDILTVIYWAKQVASALEHLHSRNDPVIYADLKAENVLIKEIPCICGLADESWKIITNYTRNNLCRKCNGLRIDLVTLKISDFNVSITGTIKYDGSNGSVPWMSPEVLECSDYTVFSDVWSFANFLWEVLSRRIPYKNFGPYAIHTFLEKDELPLPLPNDLPDEMLKIFKSCWMKNPLERSTIKDIVKMLDVAEQNIDNTYKWILPKEEEQPEDEVNEMEIDEIKELTYKAIIKDEEESDSQYICRGESIKIPIYEAICLIQRYGSILGKELDAMKKLGISIHHPPAPPRRRCLKKSKLNKQCIGPPIDFRHNVSARVRSSSSDEKVLIIHRLKKDVHNQDRHRSHDSLLDQNIEDNNNNNNRDEIYSILDDSQHKNPNRPNKFRQHQYLTLSTCNNKNEKQIIKDNIDEIKCNTKNVEEFNKNNNNKKEERGLSRTNAVRPKICEQLVLVENKKNNSSSSSTNASSPSDSSVSSSSSSDNSFEVNQEGFVVVSANGEDFQNTSNQIDKSFNVAQLFNQKISPPPSQQQHHFSSSSSNENNNEQQHFNNNNRKSFLGNLNKEANNNNIRKSSNSIFYVEAANNENLSKTTTPENDSSSSCDPPINSCAKSSIVKRSWMNKIFGGGGGGTSPRPSICSGGGGGDDFSSNNLEMINNIEPVQLEKLEMIGFDNKQQQNDNYHFTITTPKYKKRTTTEFVKSRHHHHKSNNHQENYNNSKDRLSINTIIQMQDDDDEDNNNYQKHSNRSITSTKLFFEPIDEDYTNSFNNKMSCGNNNSARSYTDLNTTTNNNIGKIQSSCLFIPEETTSTAAANCCLHQRSKSSENPSQSSSDLFKFMMQPVPANITFSNPSYVPMKDNNLKTPILPSTLPKNNNLKNNNKIDVPIPLPRKSKFTLGASPRRQIIINNNDQPWPTSIAPMNEKNVNLKNNINKDNNGQVVIRPNSLRLFPTSSTTTTSLNTTTTPSTFTNVNNPLSHCDSGIYPEGSTDDETKQFNILDNQKIISFSSSDVSSSPQIFPRLLDSRVGQKNNNASPPPLPPKRIHGLRIPPLPVNIKKVDRF